MTRHKGTQSVHAGQRADNIGVVNPVEPSSAFQYVDEGEKFYPRYYNTPNQKCINQKLAALENGQAALVFGSGMATIATTLLALLKPGDHAVMLESLYGGTRSFVDTQFETLGLEHSVAQADVESLLAATRNNTRVLFIETPANPLMQIVDLEKLANAARERGILTIADNTFASPINQNPIDFGIDIVIHSGTKYLGGHSDLSFGAVIGKQDKIDLIREKGINLGANLNALTCYLIERSLKTLEVRVQRQNHNAEIIAGYLNQSKWVEQVFFCGLPAHPNHDLARKQMHGFGGMISFRPVDSIEPTALVRALNLFTPAMSLGGVESTVTIPRFTSHQRISSQERQRLGIGDNLTRLSIGIENAEDLIADLEQAFDAVVKNKTMSGQPV